MNTASTIFSIFLFFGMFSLVGAALLSNQFKNKRQSYLLSWIIGMLLIAVAVFLIAIRDFAPDWASYKLGNSVNIAAYVFFYYAFVSLLGREFVFSWVALKAFLAAAIFFIALILVGDNIGVNYQPALVALCSLVFNFFTGQLTFKFYRQTQISSAYVLAAILFATALVWGIRCLMVLFGSLGFAFQGGIVNLISLLLLLCFGIAKYLSFSGLVNSIEWNEKEWLMAKNNEIKELLEEKEQLIYGLIKANKTSVTGALTASLAHELNQPLGASKLNIEFLKMQLEKGALQPDVGNEVLASLESDNKRAARIVSSLRSIFMDKKSQFEKVQIGDLVAKVLDIVNSELKAKHIQVELRIEGALAARVNPTEIKQVILNLVSNAVQALVTSKTLEPKIVIEVIKAGHLIQLSITDNGDGITADYMPQLFELLNTTRQTGMGLGLWLCKYIVTRFGGSIYYEDAVNGGAKFVVELPAY